MTATIVSAGLDALVGDLDDAVHQAGDVPTAVEDVVRALRPWCGRPGLLPTGSCRSDPEHYQQTVLHAAPDGSFSLAALVWLPGQITPIHDHLTWCVVGVHEGAEYETRYRFGADGETLEEAGRARADVGDVSALMPPGDIHRVSNDGTDVAVSLHVYGADIRRGGGSSIRRIYDASAVRR